MTKEQLRVIINNKFKERAEEYLNEAHTEAKLQKYADANNKISNTALATFALSESIVFNKDLIYSVLSDVLPLDD